MLPSPERRCCIRAHAYVVCSTCSFTVHLQLLKLACVFRGNRTILQNCQAALTGTFNASADPTASVCPSNGGANASSAAYTDMQCSTGYEGRLCSICQQGHGLSGWPAYSWSGFMSGYALAYCVYVCRRRILSTGFASWTSQCVRELWPVMQAASSVTDARTRSWQPLSTSWFWSLLYC